MFTTIIISLAVLSVSPIIYGITSHAFWYDAGILQHTNITEENSTPPESVINREPCIHQTDPTAPECTNPHTLMVNRIDTGEETLRTMEGTDSYGPLEIPENLYGLDVKVSVGVTTTTDTDVQVDPLAITQAPIDSITPVEYPVIENNLLEFSNSVENIKYPVLESTSVASKEVGVQTKTLYQAFVEEFETLWANEQLSANKELTDSGSGSGSVASNLDTVVNSPVSNTINTISPELDRIENVYDSASNVINEITSEDILNKASNELIYEFKSGIHTYEYNGISFVAPTELGPDNLGWVLDFINN
jgi:hypothetical protein